MINMAVISLKDIIKYLIKITVVITIIVTVIKYSSNIKTNIQNNELIKNNSLISCLGMTLPSIASVDEKQQRNEVDFNPLKFGLSVELEMLSSITNKNNIQVAENLNTNEENTSNVQNTEQAQTGLETEVQKSDVPEKYTTQYNGVKIKNETDYKLTKELLTPDIDINTENILIFHTHASESYTSSEKYTYKPTGNFRTTDKNYSVIRVGRELDNQLTSYGYKVIHNETLHDYPSYSGSYTNSLKTVTEILEKNENIDIVIDLHRDAIADTSYAPTVKIGDEYAAQIMFVIGGNGSKIKHENWAQNLKFAVKIQETANKLYPGLFKPIILRYSGYNQHVSKAAVIIEVGATGNTLDQTLVSMKYLAKAMDEALK